MYLVQFIVVVVVFSHRILLQTTKRKLYIILTVKMRKNMTVISFLQEMKFSICTTERPLPYMLGVPKTQCCQN